MMTIQKGLIGQLRAASDKSITHRAIILGAMAVGKTHIMQPLLSDDIRQTIHGIQQLGVDVVITEHNDIIIDSLGIADIQKASI